jgi:hypothetical protein
LGSFARHCQSPNAQSPASQLYRPGFDNSITASLDYGDCPASSLRAMTDVPRVRGAKGAMCRVLRRRKAGTLGDRVSLHRGQWHGRETTTKRLRGGGLVLAIGYTLSGTRRSTAMRALALVSPLSTKRKETGDGLGRRSSGREARELGLGGQPPRGNDGLGGLTVGGMFRITRREARLPAGTTACTAAGSIPGLAACFRSEGVRSRHHRPIATAPGTREDARSCLSARPSCSRVES